LDSASLESAWNSLKEIAGERGMTLMELVAAIDGDRTYSTFCAWRLSRSAGIIENRQIWSTIHRYLNDPSELRFGIDAAAVTREAEEEMGQMIRFAGLETTGLKLGDLASCDTFQSARF
jgi:hypothetical protein